MSSSSDIPGPSRQKWQQAGSSRHERRLGGGRCLRYSPLAMLSLLLLAGGGCAPERESSDTEWSVAVTLPVLAGIVGPLVGPSVRVEILLPAGASPHGFEPRPSDLRLLSRSNILVRVDQDVDGWMPSLKEVETVTLSDLLETPAKDPHLWFDPALIRALLPRLAEALCVSLEPQECPGYRERAEGLGDAILRADLEIAQRLGTVQGTHWIISGPYFEPFLHHFGLTLGGIVQRIEGVSPSPSDLASIIGGAVPNSVVIAQSRLPEEAAQLVSAEADIPLLRIDPVGGAPAIDHAVGEGIGEDIGEYPRFLIGLADSLLQAATR